MIRPLLGPVLFVVLGVALGVGLNDFREAVAPAHDMERLRFQRMLDHADKVRALAAGSSHSLAIDFKGVEVPGYHVWSLGQDFFELETQLRWLLPRLPALEVVLMDISWGSFHRDNGACTDPERGMARRKFYATSPGYGRIAGDAGEWFKGVMTSQLVTEDHWRDVFFTLIDKLQGKTRGQPQYRDMLHPDGRIMGMTPGRPKTNEWLADEARHVSLPRHERLQANMLENNPHIEEQAMACFGRILDLIEERGLRLVVYIPPLHPAYIEGFDAETRDATLRNMQHFVDTRGVEFYDFSQDKAFIHHPEFFSNSDHLSAEGALRFSRARIRPLLKE